MKHLLVAGCLLAMLVVTQAHDMKNKSRGENDGVCDKVAHDAREHCEEKKGDHCEEIEIVVRQRCGLIRECSKNAKDYYEKCMKKSNKTVKCMGKAKNFIEKKCHIQKKWSCVEKAEFIFYVCNETHEHEEECKAWAHEFTQKSCPKIISCAEKAKYRYEKCSVNNTHEECLQNTRHYVLQKCIRKVKDCKTKTENYHDICYFATDGNRDLCDEEVETHGLEICMQMTCMKEAVKKFKKCKHGLMGKKLKRHCQTVKNGTFHGCRSAIEVIVDIKKQFKECMLASDDSSCEKQAVGSVKKYIQEKYGNESCSAKSKLTFDICNGATDGKQFDLCRNISDGYAIEMCNSNATEALQVRAFYMKCNPEDKKDLDKDCLIKTKEFVFEKVNKQLANNSCEDKAVSAGELCMLASYDEDECDSFTKQYQRDCEKKH